VTGEISIESKSLNGWEDMRGEFAGKTGLIIGGSSGIGKTVSRILLERGADAVMIVGMNEQKLRAAELELGSFGKVITSHANIADSGQLDRLLGGDRRQICHRGSVGQQRRCLLAKTIPGTQRRRLRSILEPE
jgi:FlaA1/EpsC-like NDP-sugar epimerase